MEISKKKAMSFGAIIILMVFAYWSVNKKPTPVKDSSFSGLIAEREKSLKRYRSYIRESSGTPFINEYERLQMGNIYSNYFFKLSIDLPDTWEVDKGVSEHTLIRAFQADSGISIALNIVPIKSEDEYYHANKLFNWDESSLIEYKRRMYNEIKSNTSIEPQDLKVYSTKIGTNSFLVTSFKNIEHLEGDTYTHKTTTYQAYKYKYFYTISYSAPEIFYDSTVVKSALNRFTMLNPDFDK